VLHVLAFGGHCGGRRQHLRDRQFVTGRIRRVAPDGIVTTVLGGGGAALGPAMRDDSAGHLASLGWKPLLPGDSTMAD
jgi:hypothetical protein